VEPLKLRLALTVGLVVEMLYEYRWPGGWNAVPCLEQSSALWQSAEQAICATLPLQGLREIA